MLIFLLSLSVGIPRCILTYYLFLREVRVYVHELSDAISNSMWFALCLYVNARSKVGATCFDLDVTAQHAALCMCAGQAW